MSECSATTRFPEMDYAAIGMANNGHKGGLDWGLRVNENVQDSMSYGNLIESIDSIQSIESI